MASLMARRHSQCLFNTTATALSSSSQQSSLIAVGWLCGVLLQPHLVAPNNTSATAIKESLLIATDAWRAAKGACWSGTGGAVAGWDVDQQRLGAISTLIRGFA